VRPRRPARDRPSGAPGARLRFRLTAALAILVGVPIAHASVWVEPLLQDLDAAALKWSGHHPVRYTYTLGVGSGPFGSSSVRVKVVDGQCVAKTRFEFGRHKSRWKKCPCDGFMMEDVFARLRKGLEGKPSDFTADYDPRYGYVKRASVDPDAKLQDVDWGYYMKSFKVTK